MRRASRATRRILPREAKPRRALSREAEEMRKSTKRMREARKRMLKPRGKPRWQREIEKRGIRFKDLPEDIRDVVKGIKRDRFHKLTGLLTSGTGSFYEGYELARGVSEESRIFLALGAFTMAAGISQFLASEMGVKLRYRKLEDALIHSTDPRIENLSMHYPFFIVDLKGNIWFTSRKRFLRFIGILRGKTTKETIVPDFRRTVRKMEKRPWRRKPIFPSTKRYMKRLKFEKEKAEAELKKEREKIWGKEKPKRVPEKVPKIETYLRRQARKQITPKKELEKLTKIEEYLRKQARQPIAPSIKRFQKQQEMERKRRAEEERKKAEEEKKKVEEKEKKKAEEKEKGENQKK